MRPAANLLLAALLSAVALAPPIRCAEPELRAGDQVADFAFTDFAGNQHRLSEFAGRYVLLDFWATWCLPCLKEIPDLKSASERFRSRHLVIVGMNSDKKLPKARQFVENNGIPWLQSSTAGTRQVVRALKIEWYPTLILLDPHGKVLAVSLGEKPPLYGPSLLPTLERMLPKNTTSSQ